MTLTSNTRIITFVLAVHTIFLMSFCMKLIGLQPYTFVLRSIFGFILLTFLPGILFLGILGLGMNRWEHLIYSIVTSLGLLLLLGLFSNLLYIFANVKPITEINITLIITGLIFLLVLVFRILKKQLSLPSYKSVREIFTPLSLFILLLPFLATLGAFLVNYYSNPMLILSLNVIIAAFPLFLIWGNIDEKYYPLIVWGISLSLLLQNTLAVAYPTAEGDQTAEYYAANLVITHGFWDPSFEFEKYAMLRVALLHPIYSLILGINLISEFKIIHPLLFSTISLVLYKIFCKQFSPRIAVLSTFLFIFSFPFFTELANNTRTGLALLFVAVFTLLLLDSQISNLLRSVLLTIIMFSLIVSHYGVAYIFLFMLLGAYLLMHLDIRFWQSSRNQQSTLTLTLVILFAVLLYAWYIYTASSEIFSFLTTIFYRDILTGIINLFGPRSGFIWALTTPSFSFTYEFIKFQFLIVTLLSVVGLLMTLIKCFSSTSILKSKMKSLSFMDFSFIHLNRVYFYLSILALMVLLTFALPVMGMGVDRTWMFAGLFLSPYVVLGTQSLMKLIHAKANDTLTYKLFSIFLMIILFVNSGFIATTITHERSPQPNLDRVRIMSQGTEAEKFHLFNYYMFKSDISATSWLFLNRDDQIKIYSSGDLGDCFPSYLTYTEYDPAVKYKPPGLHGAISEKTINNKGYFFLSKKVFILKRIVPDIRPFPSYSYISFINLSQLNLNEKNKIYDNGGSQILFKEK